MRKPKPMKIITWTSWNTEKKTGLYGIPQESDSQVRMTMKRKEAQSFKANANAQGVMSMQKLQDYESTTTSIMITISVIIISTSIETLKSKIVKISAGRHEARLASQSRCRLFSISHVTDPTQTSASVQLL